MSAVEEYRRARQVATKAMYLPQRGDFFVPAKYADAAIAELEAENERLGRALYDDPRQLRKRAEQAEAERDKWWDACKKAEAENAGLRAQLGAVDATLARRPALAKVTDRRAKVERACSMAGRAEQAEAELAALEGRRCATCANWNHGHGDDGDVVNYCRELRHAIQRTFGCNRWAKRGAG